MQRRDVLRLIGSAAALPMLSALSAERLWGLAQDTHARAAAAAGAGVLTPHQLETVAVIGEHILPRTDTPGARDVGVPAFIDLLMTEWYDAGQLAEFVSGLAAIDAAAVPAGAADFVSLPPEAQLSLIGALDLQALALGNAAGNTPGSAAKTFRTIKSLTVFGYFTSEPVQRDVLKVNIWPNRYDGCIPA
ncbi:MAG TPA: gluconate 2-dehydrogenase subunit 3 family protein [Gemmatimonadales bacterium]|nr:gluconate 2-dehydrogenase subunit 3 family protein [Gemmatimonadales bacterium]